LLANYPYWVALSLGIGLAIAGALLLVLYAIVGWATSIGGASCGGVTLGCGGSIFQFVFLAPGAGLLLIGGALLAIVLRRAL
jgi:hypothetical protein